MRHFRSGPTADTDAVNLFTFPSNFGCDKKYPTGRCSFLVGRVLAEKLSTSYIVCRLIHHRHRPVKPLYVYTSIVLPHYTCLVCSITSNQNHKSLTLLSIIRFVFCAQTSQSVIVNTTTVGFAHIRTAVGFAVTDPVSLETMVYSNVETTR